MAYIEFKPGEKYAAKGAEVSDSPDAFNDCGYLIKSDELIVDIDEVPKPIIREMLDWFDIKTQVVWTDRGAHLYFKKPQGIIRTRNGVCELGFPVELKTSTNTKNGITIKRNGVLRQIDNEGEREELPQFFKTSTKFKSLLSLSEGDGRNNALFAHKAALGSADDVPTILRFINSNVFMESLPDKELNALIKSEVKSSSGNEESQVADIILKERKCVKWSGQIWFWDHMENGYVTDKEVFKRVVFKYCEGKKTTFVDEVIKQIDYRCKCYPNEHVFKIRFKNGYLDNGKFVPIEYEEFTPYYIEIDYKEDAEPVEIVDDYLLQLTNKEGASQEDIEDYKKVLLECIASGLVVDPEKTREMARMVIFRGEGANGKGTLLQIIRKIYGPKNCTALSIDNLEEMPYLMSMVGKLVNLGDDMEDKPITKKQFKILKNITTADTIEGRKLYEGSQSVMIQSKMIFTSNHDVKTSDKGKALERRLYWMPMFNTVTKPDPRFISKITTPEALEYWARLMVEAYMRLFKNGWTQSAICDDYNKKYHIFNNRVARFVEEIGLEEVLGKTMKEVEELFDEWNSDDGKRPAKSSFKTLLWEKYKVGLGKKKIAKIGTWVFMKQSETKQDVSYIFK